MLQLDVFFPGALTDALVHDDRAVGVRAVHQRRERSVRRLLQAQVRRRGQRHAVRQDPPPRRPKRPPGGRPKREEDRRPRRHPRPPSSRPSDGKTCASATSRSCATTRSYRRTSCACNRRIRPGLATSRPPTSTARLTSKLKELAR
jgi:hypothetical protein